MPFYPAKGRELLLFYPDELGPLSDKTQTFNDALGLPRRVDLFRSDGKLVSVYEVQQSTNFLGWNIPLRFTATQYETRDGQSKPDVVTSAIVTSIRDAPEPVVPPEVLTAAKHY